MDLPDFDDLFDPDADPDLSDKKQWARVPEAIRKNVEQYVAAHLPADILAKLRDLHARGIPISSDPAFFHVLRPGGTAKVMIYHKWSLTGYMLWMRYGLMRGRPGCGLEYIYANFLESPGTKAYTVDEARQLFGQFSDIRIAIQVNYGNLLQSEVGRRHRGPLLSIAKNYGLAGSSVDC